MSTQHQCLCSNFFGKGFNPIYQEKETVAGRVKEYDIIV